MTDETRFRAPRAIAQPQPVPPRTGGAVRRFEDPLAELARLIGQDDPFADFAPHKAPVEKRRLPAGNTMRTARPAQPHHEERDYYEREQELARAPKQEFDAPDHDHHEEPAEPLPSNGNGNRYSEVGFDDSDLKQGAEQFADEPPQTYAKPVPSPAPRQPQRQTEQAAPAQNFRPQPRYDEEFEREFADQLHPQQQRSRFSRTQEEDYEFPVLDPQPRKASQTPVQNWRGRDQGARDQAAYDNSYDRQNGYAQDQRYYEDDRYEQEAYAEQPQPKRAPSAPKAQDARAPKPGRNNGYDDYADDAHLPAHTDDYYEETPKKSGKNWLVIGTAAACLVVLTGTGVFAYRTIFGTSGAPKTIKAETAPTKVTPVANTQAEPGKNNDRVGFDAPPSAGERIVSRQEEPVGRAPAPGGSPFAPVPQSGPPPRQQAQAPAPMAAEGEPKRVRTYSVRADGSVVGDQRATGSARQVSNAPMSINSYAERDNAASRDPIPSQPAQQQGRAPTQQSSAPAPASGNPWADIPAQQRAAPQQQAALPPSGPPPVQRAPAPAIAVNTPPPAGSYVVQVASQKTEQEAQSAWQQAQSRYGSVLGGQNATIRRVNLGERGTFYRAQLGPFSDRARASEICENLKAAGGECIIQRN